jgi:hypothetical protein
MSPTSGYAAVYQSLLSRCLPYAFRAPWDFLRPDDDARGPVCDPDAALAELRKEFDDDALLGAGVIDPASSEPRLRPELVDPECGVVALRGGPGRDPFCLLTARGCLPRRPSGIAVAFKDAWTRAQAERRGQLFAAWRIGEVALLRALGLPATLAVDLTRGGLRGLHHLDDRFAMQALTTPPELVEELARTLELARRSAGGKVAPAVAPDGKAPGPAPTNAGDPAMTGLDQPSGAAGALDGAAAPAADDAVASDRPRAARPALVLVAWSPLGPTAAPPPALAPAVAHLRDARRYFGFEFAGIEAWRPDDDFLANLRFRLTFRDRSAVRELLEEASGSVDFEELAPGGADGPAPPGYAAALGELAAALAENQPRSGRSDRMKKATAVYEAAVQRELIGPLVDWALASGDPIVKNTGVQVAAVARQLHALAPLLTELQCSRLEAAGGADIAPGHDAWLRQYVALAGRFCALLHQLQCWRNR